MNEILTYLDYKNIKYNKIDNDIFITSFNVPVISIDRDFTYPHTFGFGRTKEIHKILSILKYIIVNYEVSFDIRKRLNCDYKDVTRIDDIYRMITIKSILK